jgi:hypothetical protein
MKNSSPSNKAKAEAAEVDPLRITRLGLHGSYTPLEIATLAAICRGSDLDARFQDAFGLLAHAEELARLGPWGIELKDRIERGVPLAALPAKIKKDGEIQEAYDHRIALAERLCAEAKRDKLYGKILRSPFMLQVCSSFGVSNEMGHSNRLYNDWLRYAAVARSKDLTEVIMHRRGGPLSWPVDLSEASGGQPATETEIAEFKSRFESGKTATLHDDHVAKWLAVELFFWLGSRPKPAAKTISRKAPRSRKEDTKGQFVASRTKDAEKDEKSGRFASPR